MKTVCRGTQVSQLKTLRYANMQQQKSVVFQAKQVGLPAGFDVTILLVADDAVRQFGLN